MMTEPDGIDEALEHHLRLALQATSLAVQRSAQGRAERDRTRARALEADTRRQEARAQADRYAFRVQESLMGGAADPSHATEARVDAFAAAHHAKIGQGIAPTPSIARAAARAAGRPARAGRGTARTGVHRQGKAR